MYSSRFTTGFTAGLKYFVVLAYPFHISILEVNVSFTALPTNIIQATQPPIPNIVKIPIIINVTLINLKILIYFICLLLLRFIFVACSIKPS